MNTVKGSCFCGKVAFQITPPTLFCGHCHCSMCRRPHGAPFVTWVGVPMEQFEITHGQEDLQTFTSSEKGRRQFCATCGSQLFCYHLNKQGQPKFMDVTLASLKGQIDRQPEAHFYYDSKADWVEANDTLPKLGGPQGNQPL